jgi:hypothetical protein
MDYGLWTAAGNGLWTISGIKKVLPGGSTFFMLFMGYYNSRIQMLRKLMGSLGSPWSCNLIGVLPWACL